MATPLGSVFSTIDSVKRVLADRLGNPVADLGRTLGRAKEDAAAFRATQQKGGPAAVEAMLNTVLNAAPIGMIGKAGLSNLVPDAYLSTAEKLINSGNSLDAYEQFGVFKDTRISQDLLKVIDDTLGALRTSKLDKTSGGRVTAKGYASANELLSPGGRSMYTANKLTDLLDQPELYTMAPLLKDTLVVRGISDRKGVTPGTRTANYSPGLNVISMGEFDTAKQFHQALLHEANHAVAKAHGLPSGSSPRVAYGGTMPQALRFLAAKAQTDQLPPGHPDRDAMQRIARNAFNSYIGDPGESISRLTEEMFKRNDYITHPLTLMRSADIVPTQFVGPYDALNNTIQDILTRYTGPKP